MDECPICFDIGQPSHLLPCLHQICFNCFQDILNEAHNQQNHFMECFICHEQFNPNSLLTKQTLTPKSPESFINCSKHADMPLRTWCCDCRELLCVACSTLPHSSWHTQLSSKQDVLNHCIKTLKLQLLELSQRATNIDGASSNIQKYHTEIQRNGDTVCKRIKDTFTTLTRQVESKQDRRIRWQFRSLLKRVRERPSKVILALPRDFITQVEVRQKALIAEACRLTQSDLKILKLQLEGLDLAKELMQTAQDHAQHLLTVIDDVLSKDDASWLNESLFQVLQTFIMVSNRIETLVRVQHVLAPLAQHVLRFRMQSNPLALPPVETGYVGYLRDYQSIVSSELTLKYFINDKVNKIATLPIPGAMHNTFNSPQACTVTPYDQLIVADTRARRLLVFSRQGELVDAIACVGVPQSVAMALPGEIWIVSSRDAYASKPEIHCLSWEGVVIAELPLLKALQIAACPNGDVVVTTGNEEVVYFCRHDLQQPLWRVRVHKPHAIAATQNNEIIVDSSGKFLMVLSAVDGHLIRMIGRNYFSNVQSIAVAPDGLILVFERGLSVWTPEGDLVDSGLFRHSGYSSLPHPMTVFHDGTIALCDSALNSVDYW